MHNIQEFLLTPSQFGIPNSRLRYYLIAKVQPNTFCFETFQEVQSFFPLCTCYHYTQNVNEKDQKCSNCNKIIHQCVSRVIRNKFSEWHASHHTHSYPLDRLELSLSSFLKKVDDPRTYLVKKRDLLKYAKVFDIVHPTSRGSCCFTRGYAHYAQGTGSVIQHSQTVDLDEVFKTIQEIETTDPRYESLLSSLQLRYFTPREILKLMCFPQSFDIPQSCSIKQSYKALGNSINVFVVTLLLIILLD